MKKPNIMQFSNNLFQQLYLDFNLLVLTTRQFFDKETILPGSIFLEDSTEDQVMITRIILINLMSIKNIKYP